MRRALPFLFAAALAAHPGHTTPLGLKATVLDARRGGPGEVRVSLRLLNASPKALAVKAASVSGATVHLPKARTLLPKGTATWDVRISFPGSRPVPSVFVLEWDLGEAGKGRSLVALEA